MEELLLQAVLWLACSICCRSSCMGMGYVLGRWSILVCWWGVYGDFK